jgi:uncharacterized protein (DUF1684 family)
MTGTPPSGAATPDRPPATQQLELVQWRRRTHALYAAVRAEPDPAAAHRRWRRGRDELFHEHPQSPLPAGDPLRAGLPYWPYDPELRLLLQVRPALHRTQLRVPTGDDPPVVMTCIGRVELPAPLDGRLDLWWLDQYGGGLFLPVRDGTAGSTSYGGGRYLLDTAKGADLGSVGDSIVIDLNFLYHPSCRYSPAWTCPLAPAGNTIGTPVEAGERLLPLP